MIPIEKRKCESCRYAELCNLSEGPDHICNCWRSDHSDSGEFGIPD